jgi:hypothetical protein
MSDEPPQISILDARLAEIDRRLGAIQTGLLEAEGGPPHDRPARPPLAVAERPPPSVAERPPPSVAERPPPSVAERPPPSVAELPPTDLPPRVEIPHPLTAAGTFARRSNATDTSDATAAVVAELGQLATAHARMLESLQKLVSSYERVLARIESRPPTVSPTQFSVSAGPFPSTEALRGFERTLARIPEVREVQVRGYEGGDRAIVDVRLHEPTA